MEKQRVVMDELIKTNHLSGRELIEQIAAIAQHTKVGNCEEMACLALAFLQELIPASSIELVTTYNHMFVVIDRDSKSDITNPASYGSNTVICDPWAKRAYKAADFFVERDLYRPAAPTDLFSEGSYLKGKLSVYYSYIPQESTTATSKTATHAFSPKI